MDFYALKPVSFLTPLLQIIIVAGLFIWATLWQYGEYTSTGKMWKHYPVRISLLFVPIYEEFIFRGLLLSYLLTVYPAVTAVIITSLLFGLWHLKNIFYAPKSEVASQMLYTGIFFGPIMAIITLWTGTIWIAVILHYLNNLVGPRINKIIEKK